MQLQSNVTFANEKFIILMNYCYRWIAYSKCFLFNHVDSYLVLVDELNDALAGLHKEDELELFIIASFNYNT